jgi:hypothetical protein
MEIIYMALEDAGNREELITDLFCLILLQDYDNMKYSVH